MPQTPLFVPSRSSAELRLRRQAKKRLEQGSNGQDPDGDVGQEAEESKEVKVLWRATPGSSATAKPTAIPGFPRTTALPTRMRTPKEIKQERLEREFGRTPRLDVGKALEVASEAFEASLSVPAISLNLALEKALGYESKGGIRLRELQDEGLNFIQAANQVRRESLPLYARLTEEIAASLLIPGAGSSRTVLQNAAKALGIKAAATKGAPQIAFRAGQVGLRATETALRPAQLAEEAVGQAVVIPLRAGLRAGVEAAKTARRGVAEALVRAPGEVLPRAGLKVAGVRRVAGATEDIRFRGMHRPLTVEGGAARLNDLLPAFGEDIYSANAVRFFGTGDDALDSQTIRILQSLRGKPEAEVIVYRTVPKDAAVSKLIAGDWVTLNRQYVVRHGEAALGGEYKVLHQKVKAKDLTTNADSIHEQGYYPEVGQEAGARMQAFREGRPVAAEAVGREQAIQPGMGVGERPSQGALFAERPLGGQREPLVSPEGLAAQQGRRAEIARGQQGLPGAGAEGRALARVENPELVKAHSAVDEAAGAANTADEALAMQQRALARTAGPPGGEPPVGGGGRGEAGALGGAAGGLPGLPAGINRAMAMAEALVKLDTPGAISNLMLRIPFLRQVLEFVSPRLEMFRKGQQNILRSWVAQQGVKASLSGDMYGSYVPTIKAIERAFSVDFLEGRSKLALNAKGRAMKQPEWAGELIDFQRFREGIFDLTDEQLRVLESIDPRNDALLLKVNRDYETEIGRFANTRGVHLPNVDVSESAQQILEELGRQPSRAFTTGRGKTRIFETAYDRWLRDPTFRPSSDGRKLLAAMDNFKINRAATETFKRTSGGRTLMEVLEETHPTLLGTRKMLNRRVQSLRGRLRTAERQAGTTAAEGKRNLGNINKRFEKAEALVEEIEGLGPEAGDEAAKLARELRDIATEGRRFAQRNAPLEERYLGAAGKATTLADELGEALTGLSSIRRAVKAANVRGYTLVQEGGMFRYFKPAEAKTVRQLLQTSENAALDFIENIRKGVLVLDGSPITGVQAPLAWLGNPVNTTATWTRGLATGVKRGDIFGAFKMEQMAKDIADNPELYSDFAFMLGFPVGRTPEEFTVGYLSKLPFFGGKIAAFNEAMFTATMRTMARGYEHEVNNMLKVGVEPIQAKALAADLVSKGMPIFNPARQGLSQARAKAIRSTVISVSFIVRPAELVTEATFGYVKLLAGQTLTPKQHLAVKMVTTLMGSIASLSIASAVISAKAKGRDELEAVKEVVNPNSGKFMSIVVGDRRVLIGGPFRGLMKAVLPQERNNWVPFGGIVQYAKGRFTPVGRTTLDLLQNKDFYGQKIGVSEGPRRILEYVAYAAEGMMPITLQEALRGIRTDIEPGEILEQVASQALGWNMYSSTPFQLRDAEVNKWAEGKKLPANNFWELSPSQRKQFEKERPDLFEVMQKETKRRAKFGDPTATRRVEADLVKEKATKQQEGDDADKAAGQLDGKEWRERRRRRMDFLSGQRDRIYAELETQDPKTPTDFYYRKLDELRETSNGIMDDEAWEELDRWIASLPQAEQRFIQENTLLSPLTPLVGQYYADIDMLEEYWGMNEVMAQRLNPQAAAIWREYLAAPDFRQRDMRRQDPWLSQVISWVSTLRERLRGERPAIDAALIRWGYVTRPLTRQGVLEMQTQLQQIKPAQPGISGPGGNQILFRAKEPVEAGR